ncbi:MAG: DEAD/DEAH box helicase family protein, partial [Candidatus Acidiferrales bacterium]
MPLDMVFTYRVPADAAPVVGGRVLVPFRQQRLTGIVVELHDRKPSVATKTIQSVLDITPVIEDQLLRLGRWIADYYLAPLGEVFRAMLPLNAEFKRAIAYRITKEGQLALHLAGMSGSSARSRRTPEEQAAEFRVLDYLAAEEPAPGEAFQVNEATLRSTTRVSKFVLIGMVRKKWLVREDVSAVRDATRTIKIALLKSADGKLNENQRLLVETLAASGGRVPVETLQALEVPRTTLKTLAKRGLVEIIEEPATFAVSRSKPRPSRPEFDFNAAQQAALNRLREAVEARTFSGILLHGVTGSGKTAVYLAGMRAVLDAGRSAILLVPEIGLTPAVAADLHQIFGDEVAILHSALSDKERAQQ